MKKKVALECNNVKCAAPWTLVVEWDRINGNRLTGLEFCPVCGRYDSHYITDIGEYNPRPWEER